MCTNAVKTAANLLTAIEPTIKNLLTETNLINTPDAVAALKAYDAALAAVEAWTPGTPAQEVLEVLSDLQTGLGALPIPTTYTALLNIIFAGIETVIGVLTANSPAPVAPTPPATEALVPHEDTQAMHQAAVIADTTAKVQALVPNFKRSIWHSPESQYIKTWNQAVEDGNFPATLKAA